MTHVFIAYKRENRNFAVDLRKRLEAAGLQTWMDENIPEGKRWREEIDTKLKEALAVIVIITPEAVTSVYVQYEWMFALGAGKQIIPIMLHSAQMPYRLEEIQFLDFRTEYQWEPLISRLKIIESKYVKPDTHVESFINNWVKEAIQGRTASDRTSAIDELSLSNHPSSIDALAILATTGHTSDIRIHASKKLANITAGKDVRAKMGLIEGLEKLGAYATFKYEAEENELAKYIGIIGGEDTALLLLQKNKPQYVNKKNIEYVRKLAQSEQGQIQLSALSALNYHSDTEIIPFLESIIKQRIKNNARTELEMLAIKILDNLDHERALPILREMIQNSEGDGNFIEDTVRNICSDMQVHELVDFANLHDSFSVKETVIRLLRHQNENESVPALKLFLSDDTEISFLVDEDDLEDTLLDWSYLPTRIRDIAAFALSLIGTQEALDAVENYTQLYPRWNRNIYFYYVDWEFF